MKNTIFNSLTSLCLCFLIFSCDKDGAVPLPEEEQVSPLAIIVEDEPQEGEIPKTCNCEYEVTGRTFDNADPAYHLEHYLSGGVSGVCSSSCYYFWGQEGNCLSTQPCMDIFSSYPTGFLPFNCNASAWTSFGIGWVAELYNDNCNTSYLNNGSITFRLRCVDSNSTHGGCQGLGYVSAPYTLTHPPYGDVVTVELGGECGCQPTFID